MEGLGPQRPTVAGMTTEHPRIPAVVCQEIQDNNDDWVPPTMVSFPPQEDHGDEYSVISSVSDRARMS